MSNTKLEHFASRVRASWGPPAPELIAACRTQLEALLKAPSSEGWLARLLEDLPESCELDRDLDLGYVLLAHTEAQGRYRPPHDHGQSWVIYGVLKGEMEMAKYAVVMEPPGVEKLVKRGTTCVVSGEVQVYLPGDIHDTLCVSGPAILFRFTERDLRLEKHLTRYAQQGGNWVADGR